MGYYKLINMELGKLENGTIQYKSASMLIDGRWVANATDEQLVVHGFKQVIKGEYPEAQDGFCVMPITVEVQEVCPDVIDGYTLMDVMPVLTTNNDEVIETDNFDE